MADTAAALATVEATPADLAHLAPVVSRARGYAEQARATATRRAYASQWGSFLRWCEAAGAPAREPASVALWLTSRADGGASVATMAQALAAVSQGHQSQGLPSPRLSAVVRDTWAGIRRAKAAPQRRAAPLMPEQLAAMVAALPPSLPGLRDRALLLVGFAAALRRSELVALEVADVELTDEGAVLTIRRSKTDQEGHGRQVGIPYGSAPGTCPVRALRAWLTTAGIAAGPIFLGVQVTGSGERRAYRITGLPLAGRDVARIVQRTASRAGVSSAGLSGHSLRAGLATAAARAGKSAKAIQEQTGHASLAMVHRYIRRGTLFSDNAAAGIGL